MAIRVVYPSWAEAIREIAVRWNLFFKSNNRLAIGVDTDQDVIVDATSKGLVIKSPDGNYWRGAISNAGVVTWTSIGTTKP